MKKIFREKVTVLNPKAQSVLRGGASSNGSHGEPSNDRDPDGNT